ncbi:MAG: sialate O-acetylesterase [Pirellulaceae bacterium]
MKRIATLLLFLAATFPLAARGEVKLPKIFGDSMVLQQKSQAAVWGWADKGEEVTVTLGETKVSATAGDNGKWSLKLATPAAGGPFELKVKGKNEITLKDVYVGEVWICSGQSNAEWTVAISTSPDVERELARHPKIRMIKVAQNPSEKPVDDITGQWQVCSPSTVSNFSAIGYFFARHLQSELDVPVGIISTNWGGTICEAWTSKEKLNTDPDFAPILKRSEKFVPGNPNQASVLFNGMINPIVPYGVRGAIWYQGESNRDRAVQYRKLFPAVIADWRERFGQGDFPFLYVQLAPYRYGNNPEFLAEIWESQLKTLSVPNTGMCVTTDIATVGDIHPPNKQDVGRRLALWALANTYGNATLPFSGPLYDSMTVEGNKVRIKFKHSAGLHARGNMGQITHVTIAGEDQKFVAAKAKVEGEAIVVESDQVAKPVAVRFAWNELAEPNLFNGARLPASPFRTDDFPLLTKDAK